MFKKYMDRLLSSDYYIVLVATIFTMSWLLECEYIAGAFFLIFTCYILATQHTLETLIPILVMFPTIVYKEMGKRIYPIKIILGVILAVIFVGFLIYHFIKVHKKSNRKLTSSKVLSGYIISLVAILFGGIGYPTITFVGVLLNFIGAGAFTLIYIMLYKCTSGDCKSIVMKSIIAFASICIFQIIVFLLNSPNIIIAITNKEIILGWAITNSIAAILAFAIPFCFFLAYKNRNYVWIWQVVAFIFYAFIFVTNCRTMIFVGTIIYGLCIIVAIIKFPSWQLFIPLIFFFAIGVFVLINYYNIILNQFISMGISGNGRDEQYKWYFDTYKKYPVFGMGLFTDSQFQGDGVVRVHNTLLQIITSYGTFGALCFIPYYFQRYKTLIKNFSVFKLFACLFYLSFALYGMLDTAFISFYKEMLVLLVLFTCEFENTVGMEKFGKGLFPKENILVFAK